MTTSYRVLLSVRGIYTTLYWALNLREKESNSAKEKAVFIKSETACVGRFYYPPRTSWSCRPQSRILSQEMKLNELPCEETVVVSTDKNLHTAPFVGTFVLPNLLTFHEWVSTLIWESFLYVKDFICPLLSRNVANEENKTIILPFVSCTVVPVCLNMS